MEDRKSFSFCYYSGDKSINLDFNDVGSPVKCADLFDMCVRFALVMGFSEEELKKYFTLNT